MVKKTRGVVHQVLGHQPLTRLQARVVQPTTKSYIVIQIYPPPYTWVRRLGMACHGSLQSLRHLDAIFTHSEPEGSQNQVYVVIKTTPCILPPQALQPCCMRQDTTAALPGKFGPVRKPLTKSETGTSRVLPGCAQ